MDAFRPSPLQNRVTPFGDIIATHERGLFMGNRGGCFHDDAKELTRRRWVSQQWITCLTSCRGRWREVMAPRRYTELFFLDEAVAFAAGHRPCAECRRGDFNRFRSAFIQGNPHLAGGPPRAGELDAVLHRERVGPAGSKRTCEATLGELPAGVFVTFDGAEAWLVLDGSLYRWSAGGYAERRTGSPGERVAVLTPMSVVRAFAAGYVPQVHPGCSETA